MGGLVVVALAIACGGCGRMGFELHGDGAIGGDDAATADTAPLDCSSYLLCDDFEDAVFDPVWTAPPGMTLDTAFAHRGQRSAHAHLDTFGPDVEMNASLTERRTFAQFDPVELWVHAWVRLGNLPAGTNGLELISFEQVAANMDGVYLFVQRDDTTVYSQFGNDSDSRMQTMPINQWVCVVIHLVRSTQGAGTLQLASDRLMPLAISNTDTDSTPPLREIGVGLQFSAPNVDVVQPALDVWIDDVIIHDAEVTCAD